MKRFMKTSIALMLIASLFLGNFAGALAWATEQDENAQPSKPETVWNGDGLSADVKAGQNGYTFMSVYHNPANAYEMSNHMVSVDGGANNDIPQTLMLVPADKDYTWSPDGKYSFGVSNYEVLYCCDAETGYEDGVYYKRLNLEDSDYYTEEEAAHIRAIITNSYPYVSLEQMKANLVAAGVEGAADLDRAEIIAGVQAAVWFYANGEAFDYKYSRSFNISTNSQWGTVAHDYSVEMNSVIQALGKRKFNVDEAVGSRILALTEYLKGLDKVYAEQNQIIITKLEIVGANPMNNKTTIRVALNNGGSSEKDDLKLDIYVDGELVETRPINREFTSYDMNIEAQVGQTIQAVVSGTQIMPQNVYFYEPEGGRDVSQCLVGVASGETDVYAASEMTISSSSNLPVDKTATPLNKDFQTDVTLSVPGDMGNLGVDIIYILGSFLSKNEVEQSTMINVLIDTFRELIQAGVPVNFGIVPFSSTKDPVMPLTKLDSEEDLAALRETIATAIETAGNIYDGVNMENAFITAKGMFSNSALSGRPDRQHLIMVSSGQTYFFNSGENNEYVSTVPVNFVHTDKKTVSNQLFYSNKAWQRARTAQTNTYPIPKAIVDEYNNNSDKYESLWNCYWTYIDQWAKADIAAGDKVVYEATTVEAGDFLAWLQSGLSYARNTTFGYNTHGSYIADISDVNLSDYVTMYPSEDPFAEGSNSAHAIGNERAMWEAYNYVMEEIVGAGISFYPIYNELKPQYTNGNTEWCNWTDQYIGHSFMNMLAGGEAVKFSSDKVFFDSIKAEIFYNCAAGSFVEDFIGYDPEIGNFEFIIDAETTVLTVGGVQYITTQVETKEGATASFAFTKPGNDEATFWMDYYYGNGKTTEKFIWTFGENVSLANQAKLTYKLQLTDMATEAGDYWIDTNLSATLYPVIAVIVVDPEIATFAERKTVVYEYGDPVIFPVPEVEYLVEKINVEVTKKWEDANNQDGKRPESIEVELYANGEKIRTDALTSADKVDDNTWMSTFDNVVIYKLPGEEVTLEIKEVLDANSSYVASIDGLTITNKYTPELTHITVNKNWNDDNDRDNMRPESITIRLYANGVEIDSIEVTEEMGWSYTFENLNKFANGVEIEYTITEDEVAGYTTEIDGFHVTNTHEPQQTKVSVEKFWDDDDDFEGKRPENITIRLLANGEEVAVQVVTAEEGWTYTFNNLPVYADGEKIVYTVTEDTVEGYEMTGLEGDAENGFKITNQYQIIVDDPEPPRTGDPIALVFALSVISMLGMAVIVLQHKKFHA